MKPANSLCGQNEELQNVKADCAYGSYFKEQFSRWDLNKHMAVYSVTMAMFSFSCNDESSYTRIILHIFQSEFYERMNLFIAIGLNVSFRFCQWGIMN
jgi:hypothetical protein